MGVERVLGARVISLQDGLMQLGVRLHHYHEQEQKHHHCHHHHHYHHQYVCEIIIPA